MNQFFKIFAFLGMFLIASGLSAQERGVCGFLPTQESMDHVRQLKQWIETQDLATFRSGAVTYVPVKIHLAGTSNGTGYKSEGAVLDMLCELNEQYADQDIQFYIYGGFNYIPNNTLNTDPASASLIMNGHKVNNAMNIFICQNADSGGIGETLGYYSNQYDWIVIKKTEINGYSNTVPHEVGHYFSLLHPFNGWDCTWWQEDIHGNPVSSTIAPCPSGAPPYGNIEVEYVDGSNCNTAGDLLCDTPADYNLGFADGNDCNYTGNCMDPHGDVLMPMENNMMGYFNGCSDYEFTDMQKGLMAADLAQRTYLATNYTPPATSITGTISMNTPLDGETSDYYNVVLFDWDDVPGATQYFIEIDIISTFNINPIRKVSDWSGAFIYDLNPNTTYYFRVRPYNEYYTCAPYSEVHSFKTSTITGVKAPEYVSDVWLSPNPVSSGLDVQLHVQSTQTFEAELSVHTATGQKVFAEKRQFTAGDAVVSIPTTGWAPGLYLVALKSEEGVVVRKVVVGSER